MKRFKIVNPNYLKLFTLAFAVLFFVACDEDGPHPIKTKTIVDPIAESFPDSSLIVISQSESINTLYKNYTKIKAMYGGDQRDVDHFEWETSNGILVISESGKRNVAYLHKENTTAVVKVKACNGAGCSGWATLKNSKNGS